MQDTARSLTPAELAIGRRPGFGETSILIPGFASRPTVGKVQAMVKPGPELARRMEFLATSAIFAPPLSSSSLRSIAGSAGRRGAVAGTRFKAEGGLLAVLGGAVSIQLEKRQLELLKPGGSFGIECLLFRTAPLLEGLAVCDSELLFIPETVLLDKPLILWRLREHLNRRLVSLRASFPLEWIPSYSVRIEKLDSQHREEFALIDATVKYYRSKQNASEPLPIVDELILYAQDHFKTENDLMEKYGYPHFRDHRDEHERLSETLNSLRLRENEVKAAEIVDFLKDWILRHTLLTDRMYIDYLVSKGVR
jgi:hemerythrin